MVVVKTLKASKSQVVHSEDRILHLQQQLDITHKKYKNQLKALYSHHRVAVQKLKHRLAELEYKQDNQEMQSQRWNICIENIPFERLLKKIKEHC